MGDFSSTATFLGLHAQSNGSTPYKPTAASESRRRLFCQLFCIDKVTASFTGRPPLLSHRYVSTPPPLDLADGVLLDGGPALDRAVAALDPHGWSREGVLYESTIGRARYFLCSIRDEIFEIALGNLATPVETLMYAPRSPHRKKPSNCIRTGRS